MDTGAGGRGTKEVWEVQELKSSGVLQRGDRNEINRETFGAAV